MKTEELKILALTGRRDPISDGVWDYCTLLAGALRPQGIDVEVFEVNWLDRGWLAALRKLSGKISQTRCDWTLLQYTAMAWSSRGFPLCALAIAWIAKRSGSRVGVVFHESCGFQAKGIWARFRFACQQWVIRKLYSLSDIGIFTVPPASIPWLRGKDSKACFIPIGSNIPENITPRQRTSSAGSSKTVAVFCVTNLSRTDWEVHEIAAAIRRAEESVPHLRLTVFGRGAIEARHLLENALAGSGAEISILGVLPAAEVNRILSQADVLLYVRDVLSPQRGSVLAAVACGLPIVAYGDEAMCFPLSEAGVVLARLGDRGAIGCALERVLTHDSLWNSLHLRSLNAHKAHFSWEEIAERFAIVLQAPFSIETANSLREAPKISGIDGSSYQMARRPAKTDFRPQDASDAR